MTKHPDAPLLFAFEYPPVSGGISRLCAGIGDLLERAGVNVNVLTQDCLLLTPRSALTEIRVNSRRPIREWQAFRWLRKNMSATAANGRAIICGVWYPEGLVAYLAGIRPLVVMAHGAELLPPANRWRRPLWKALQRLVLENADLVIANSGYTGELVSSVAARANVKVIPLAVDLDRFAPGDREAAKTNFGVAGKRVLSTVSRIHHYKAHDTVLRAIAHLASEEREQLVYLIVGEGPHERKLRKLAQDLGIESHVRWLGFLSEQELPQIYSASDLFVLCTRDAPEERAVEGFGMVFLEAQSCGTPVVGTRTGGIPAAVQDGNGGWLIEQDDSRKLADIIRQLVRSPEFFHAIGMQARQRVLRESTWERYGQSFSSALHSVGIGSSDFAIDTFPLLPAQSKQGISIVVPTLNRGPFLLDTLHDLLAQEHRPIEILVVDQSNTEDPALLTLVHDYPDLISYHKVQFRGLPMARNYGWQQARYEAIVFVDDDIRCSPSLVGEHLRALLRPNIGMVAGGIDERISAQANSTPGKFGSWTATPERNFGARGECFVQHVGGCNFSVWRSALLAAGGFDEALAIGAALYEETELCLRVSESGFGIYFNGSARVQHLAAASGGCRVPNLRQYIRSLAQNRVLLIRRHLRWFQAPVAYLRLFLLFISYAAHYHTMGVFRPAIDGFLRGIQAAKYPPVCSQHKAEVRA
jgi:phosphatidyl-myo-inositol dimannoside synthase